MTAFSPTITPVVRASSRATTQAAQILAHLQAGNSITPRDAIQLFGCMRLAARIAELREQGHAIATVLEDDGSRRWARYSLAPAKGQLVLFDYVPSPQVPGLSTITDRSILQ